MADTTVSPPETDTIPTADLLDVIREAANVSEVEWCGSVERLLTERLRITFKSATLDCYCMGCATDDDRSGRLIPADDAPATISKDLIAAALRTCYFGYPVQVRELAELARDRFGVAVSVAR